MPWAIIDSDVYIDHWERGAHQRALDEVRRAFVALRHGATVVTANRGDFESLARAIPLSLFLV